MNREWNFPPQEPRVTLTLKENIFLLVLRNKSQDNWFDVDFMAACSSALDTVETHGGDYAALITTSQNTRIYSNGLSLEQAFERGQPYFQTFQNLLAQLLVLRIPTIAGNLESLLCISHQWTCFCWRVHVCSSS